jgi:hypothetical protein
MKQVLAKTSAWFAQARFLQCALQIEEIDL